MRWAAQRGQGRKLGIFLCLWSPSLLFFSEQQRQDFSIAAGMQYSVGDKCQVGGTEFNNSTSFMLHLPFSWQEFKHDGQPFNRGEYVFFPVWRRYMDRRSYWNFKLQSCFMGKSLYLISCPCHSWAFACISPVFSCSLFSLPDCALLVWVGSHVLWVHTSFSPLPLCIQIYFLFSTQYCPWSLRGSELSRAGKLAHITSACPCWRTSC